MCDVYTGVRWDLKILNHDEFPDTMAGLVPGEKYHWFEKSHNLWGYSQFFAFDPKQEKSCKSWKKGWPSKK
jgi:hypothetical protein